MATDIIGLLEGLVDLNPVEHSIIQSAGITSLEQLDDTLRNFPSLHKVGVRIPFLSAMIAPHLDKRFVAMASAMGSNTSVLSMSGGGELHPSGARWPLGAAVPMPLLTAPAASSGQPPTGSSAGRIDLRPSPWPVHDQGGRGTCVAFSVAAAVELALAGQGLVDLSEQFLFWATKVKTSDPHPTADGTLLAYAAEALAQHGVCQEVLWPYSTVALGNNVTHANGRDPTMLAIADAKTRLRNSTRHQLFKGPGAANFVRAALENRQAVAVGLPVFADTGQPTGYDNWTMSDSFVAGRVANPIATATVVGGHSVCITGFQPDPAEAEGGYFIFKNSWDTVWASQAPTNRGYSPAPGFGDISASYIEHYTWEALVV